MTARPDEWDRAAWGGFYTRLQQSIEGHWDYVANPSGGFMGFWWGWQEVEGGRLYLQLEQRSLVVRLAVEEGARQEPGQDRRSLREVWSRRVREITAPRFRRPDRFGSGNTMTVAVAEEGYLAETDDGRIDIDGTIGMLREAERAVAAAIEAASVPSA